MGICTVWVLVGVKMVADDVKNDNHDKEDKTNSPVPVEPVKARH